MNSIKRQTLLFALLGLGVALPQRVSAQTTTFCGTATVSEEANMMTGDAQRTPFMCNSPFVNWAWKKFGFKKSKWDDGFGYHNPCESVRPLARTFNSIHTLMNIAPSPNQFSYDPVTEPFITWAGFYAARKYDDLRGACVGPSGTYQRRAGTDRVYHRMRWWYGGSKPDWRLTRPSNQSRNNLIARASLLVHEARHDHKRHNGNGNCLQESSCDKRWEYDGANTWQCIFLNDFAVLNQNTTDAQVDLARARLDYMLDETFNNPPTDRLSIFM